LGGGKEGKMKESAEWKGRTELLLGREALDRLNEAVVAVVGLGGVGAYAAEMLVRAGVGTLIILDSDVVNETNKNRQLIALDSTMGKSKVDVLSARLLDINPHLKLKGIKEYLTEQNAETIFNDEKIDYLVDAIDTLSPKIALIKYAVSSSIPLVSSMGAGAKVDATRIRVKDISKSFNCPLAYVLRKKLRKAGISRGFNVVFSEELPDTDAIIPVEEQNKKSQVGTISYMPAVFGCIASQCAILHLIGKE
jgi:tRNA threonylcarbamoyladenosine dehydratase